MLLGCGERTISAGGDETGSADTDEGGELFSCVGPNAPTGPVVLVSGAMQPATFARVGERIYWADAWDQWTPEKPSLTLYRADVGTNGEWVAVAVEQPGINEIVATQDAIYWVVEGSSEGSGALLRASLDDEIEILDDDLLAPRALALGDADEWIYYVEGGNLNEPNAQVLRIRPDGSSKQLLAQGDGTIEDLAVDDSQVWWVSSINHEIWRVSKDGSGQSIFAEVEFPTKIQVHDGVSWVVALSRLFRLSSGEDPDYLDPTGDFATMAADSDHLYVTRRNAFRRLADWLGISLFLR